MSSIERACKFLKDAETYYLATVEGDQPRVRPFGTANIFEGKLYIQTGKSKPVSKRLRIACELIEDDRREARAAMLDAYPHLRAMYSEDDGNTEAFYIRNATATYSSFTKAPEVETF